jgi:hypothetical protein
MLVVFLAFLNLYNLVQALRTQLRIETNDILTFEVTRTLTQEYHTYYVLCHANSTKPRSPQLEKHGNSKLTHVAHVSYT